MTIRLSILLCLLAWGTSLAQQQETGLSQRMNAKWDMSQKNIMDGKPFYMGGTLDYAKKTSSAPTAFLYDQKTRTDGYTTRSFFGIKNPWIGTKIYEAKPASLWSKTLVENADRKYTTAEVMKTDSYAKSGQKANLGNSVTLTPEFIPKSGTPGAMDQINGQLKKKNMTIDQVRELLNKN